MSSFFSKAKGTAGQGIGLVKSGAEQAKGIPIIGAAKGIGILFVIVIVIIVIIYVSRSLNVGFGSLFGLGDSADDISRTQSAESEERIKELDVELKEQLEEQSKTDRDVLLEAEHTTTEEIKRVVEKEIAETEAALIDKLDEIEAAIKRKIFVTDIIDDSADKFRRLQSIWAELQKGTWVESWELKEFQDALTTGIITVHDGVLINNLR